MRAVLHSLAFYLTGLVYPVWIERELGVKGDVIDPVDGKYDQQWTLLSIACILGVFGATLLTMRIIGSRLAKPWFKFGAMVGIAAMAICGQNAFASYPVPDKSVGDRYGAGAEYTRDGFSYAMISFWLCVGHELLVRFVQRVRTQKHMKAEAQRTLEMLRDQPEEVQHARQKENI